ncbi:MAG: HEPN domain-containing protein [Planctomycetes bacterium]|nr:HEPN domain-containing protein [Planctomycetota bacterium]
MNRDDLQELARIRLNEAKLLLDGSAYDGAYYLAGYAVECAIKSCLARKTRQYDFPDRETVVKSYTHNLEQLLDLAGLRQRLADAPPGLKRNWNIVQDWNEAARYERKSPKDAQDLYGAVADRDHGVLAWLQRYW